MIKFLPMKIVDRYIIKEVLLPFLAGVAIIAIIMLSSFLFQLTDMIIIKDVPVKLVLKLLTYKLPEIIVQTFPIAILLATMVGMGRLSRDNEFSALRMGGVSVYRFIIPLLILGILISGMTYLMNEKVVPWSNHKAQNIIRKSILKEAMPGVEDNVFFKGPNGKLFYVKQYNEDSSTLKKIVIFDYNNSKNYPRIITAETGVVKKKSWQLKNGIIHKYNESGHLTLETQFDVMDIELARDIDDFFGKQKTPAEMSRAELRKEINLFKSSGLKVDSLLVDYHLKLSRPLIAFLFILLGTPLSLTTKDSRAINIVLTIAIVFLYYLILSLARSFGRNGFLPPLLAAWLPNVIFGLVGVVLLIWRDFWKDWFHRLLPGFLMLSLLFFLYVPAVQAEDKLKIRAEHLKYNDKTKQLEITGDVKAQYKHFHFLADKTIVKYEDGTEKAYNNPQEIEIQQNKFTGCDLEKPHYFFKASQVTIYPGDHLEAKNVTFWELNGRLPLMYWPYLYISLKDKASHISTKVGHNNRRGWFIKNTYHYWYQRRLPGEVYLDYYTISGFAGGLKQYFLYDPKLKGSFYFYSQENRTELPGLLNWKTAVDYSDQRGKWQTDTDFKYHSYDDHEWIKNKVNLRKDEENQKIDLSSYFKSEDYFNSDTSDDKELDLDLNYIQYFENDWKAYLDYNRDYLLNEEDGLQSRWGSKSYILKQMDNLNLKLSLERYDPEFDTDDEEDNVRFYRWPEITVEYFPSFKASLLDDVEFKFSLGKYYEDSSKVKSYRGLAEINHNKRWNLSRNISLQMNQSLSGKGYELIDFPGTLSEYDRVFDQYLSSYQNRLKMRTSLTEHLDWINRYKFNTFIGDSPFNFDNEGYEKEIRSNLNYHRGGFDFKIRGGYDIHEDNYFPLWTVMAWWVNDNWKLDLGTSYDFDTGLYENLALNSKYKDKHWQIDTAWKYDLNNNTSRRFDNRLIYELKDQFYLEANNSYIFEDGTINRADLVVKKKFHCRELRFSYDYVKQEVMIEYRLDIFPKHGIKMGSSEAEPFIFDAGIEEMIENE